MAKLKYEERSVRSFTYNDDGSMHHDTTFVGIIWDLDADCADRWLVEAWIYDGDERDPERLIEKREDEVLDDFGVAQERLNELMSDMISEAHS